MSADSGARTPADAPTAEALDRGVRAAPIAAAAPIHFMQLVDGVPVHWAVVEVDAARVPGAHRPRCLLFTRTDCIRRVWEYPPDWRGLDAAALGELSWHR